ncbi:TPA: hypothetical protein ACHJX8_001364 [Yersinia enterocolitica]
MKKTESFLTIFERYLPNNSYKDSFYKAYIETKNAGLLDKDFLAQCVVSVDRFKDRLTEIIIAHRAFHRFGNACMSQDIGPDLRINFEGKTINIESIRSSNEIKEVLGNFKVYEYDIDGKSKVYNTKDFYIDSNNFNIYAGSAIFNKTKVYNNYLTKKIITENDLNIICFNIGFYKKIDNNLINELKRFFYGMPYTILGETTPKGITAEIEYRPVNFTKEITNEDGSKELRIVEGAVFLNGPTIDTYKNIDGVIIIEHENISHEQRKLKGLFFQNRNRPEVPKDFIKELGIDHYDNVDPEHYSISMTQKTGYVH